MKKALTIIMALMMSMTLFACGNESAPAEDNKIYMGTEAGFAPYEYVSGDTVIGVDVDIAKAVAEDLGKELVIKNMDFDGALNAVQHGQVDFVAAAVSITEERAKVMDFSHNYIDSKVVAVIKAGSDKIKTPDDIDGHIIGVQQGNTTGDFVESTYTNSEMKLYTKFVQAAEDLKNDKIDVIVMDSLPAEELVKANPDLVILNADAPLFEEQYAIAVNKGNEELLNAINTTIDKLIEEGKIAEYLANHTTK